MSNGMSIETFVNCLLKLPVEVSVLARGVHGIGKSTVFRYLLTLENSQRIKDGKKPIKHFIDRRLSQMSEGDLIGLPSIVEGENGSSTTFNPPDWVKLACDEPCYVLLDEINRATTEVMQGAFQMVLDRELNGHKLHPETRVFAAINHTSDYNVNEMDIALLDRFWVVDLEPTVNDWITWAKRPHNEFGGEIHPVMIDFLNQNNKWLDPVKGGDPTEKGPSRRSWERVNRALTLAGSLEDSKGNRDEIYHLTRGFVGLQAATAFAAFAAEWEQQISGEDVINRWKKIQKKLNGLGAERQNILIEKTAQVLGTLDDLTPAQIENVKSFMDFLTGEHRIAAWTKLQSAVVKKPALQAKLMKEMAGAILQTMGVQKGVKGIGQVANVPGFFGASAKKK